VALPTYEPGQAEAYAVAKGWQFRKTGEQLVLKTCPFCFKSEQKFFISNETGLWLCHHATCAKRGNFFTLQREQGDLDTSVKSISNAGTRSKGPKEDSKRYPLSDFLPYEVNLADDPEVKDYLMGRGLTIETAQQWRLGSKVMDKGANSGKKCLMIPFLTADNHFVDIKYRGVPEKWFQRLPGHESILFGEHTFQDVPRDAAERPLYLVEGELDAITLWQHGFRPAVSTSAGAGTWKPRWYDAILAYNPTKIYVIYDNDPQGQKGAEELLKKFDDREVRNIVLPDAKDSNEYFLQHTAEEFQQLLEGAQEPEIPNIQFIGSILDDLRTEMFLSEGKFRGLESQFPMVNELIGGGYACGDLITVSGIPGVGKTTFVMQELIRHAEAMAPIYMIELEMPKTKLARKLIEHKFHIPMKEQTVKDVDMAYKYLEKVPFAVGNAMKDVDQIERIVRQGMRRHSFKAIAFDNLNYFVRSTDHVQQEISILTKRLKELAIDLDIPIFLIAQPRKFDDTERAMTIHDLKDSSSIAQDSDVVILFYRRRVQGKATDVGKSVTGFKGSHSPFTLCRVDKARYEAGGECYLYFDGAKSTYRALEPDEANKDAA
jgi:replicative DNA helicase